MKKNIYFIRHGETDSVRYEKMAGAIDDELNKIGILQIKKLLKILKYFKPNLILSSPKKRALQTANIISEYFRKDIQIINDLVEMNFGIFEGLTIKEINEKYKIDYNNWIENPLFNTPRDAESLENMDLRINKTIDNIINNIEINNNCFIITHGGPIRIALIRSLSIPKKEYWNIKIPHGSVTGFEYDGNKLKLLFMGQKYY